MLTGREDGELHSAPLIACQVRDAYQLEKGALAQFQVTNLSTEPVHLYYIVIAPTGRVKIGPLLYPLKPEGLGPHDSGVGHLFKVKGLPGTVNETRIYCSPEMLPEMLSPPQGTRVGPDLDAAVFSHVQVQTVWDQIPEEGIAGPTNVQTILSTFVW